MFFEQKLSSQYKIESLGKSLLLMNMITAVNQAGWPPSKPGTQVDVAAAGFCSMPDEEWRLPQTLNFSLRGWTCPD